MRISRLSKIVREDKLVAANVGRFKFQDAQAQIGVDIGAVAYTEYTLPHPDMHARAEKVGKEKAESRKSDITILARLPNLADTLTSLGNAWKGMMVTCTCLKVLPVKRIALSQEGAPVYSSEDTDRPAFLTLVQDTMPCVTAAKEIDLVANMVLSRFGDHPGSKGIPFTTIDGQNDVIPEMNARVYTPITGDDSILACVASAIAGDLELTELSARVNHPISEVLFAIHRARFYAESFQNASLQKKVPIEERLLRMKIYTEALSDLAPLLDVTQKDIVFNTGIERIPEFRALQDNLRAAQMIDQYMDSYFAYMPHASWMSVKSAKERWTLSGWPDYNRIMYGTSEHALSETPNRIPPLVLGGERIDTLLPRSIGDRDNPGLFRTSRSADESCLRIKIPIVPRMETAAELDQHMKFFETVEYSMLALASPYNYQGRGTGKGNVPACAINITLPLLETGQEQKWLGFPVVASVQAGSTFMGYGVTHSYQVNILDSEKQGISATNPAFLEGSSITERLNYAPVVESRPRPMPWIYW